MRRALLCSLVLLPMAAFAEGECEHTRQLELAPDLSGISTVVFEVGPYELDVQGSPGATARLHGRACASDAETLDRLRVLQRRNGDRLLIELDYDLPRFEFNLFGFPERQLSLSATLPDHVAVEVAVGSGEAQVSGFDRLELSVGSGAAVAHDLRGPVDARVGSGDIDLHDVGPLRVEAIGSGDVRARGIAGDVTVDRIGSGDAEFKEVSGSVEVGSIGSGDLDVASVQGSLRVDRVGSGDVDHAGVQGIVDLPEEG